MKRSALLPQSTSYSRARNLRNNQRDQNGFITMIVMLLVIIAVILFVAYKRVLDSQ